LAVPSISKATQCQDRPSLEQAAVGDDAPEGRCHIGEDHLGGRQHGHTTQGQAEVTLPAKNGEDHSGLDFVMEFSLYQNEKNILLILLYPFISYYLMILVSTCKSGRITRYYHLIVILYDQFCRSRATARSLAKLQCEQAARNQLAINPFHLSFKFPGEMLLSTTHDYTL